MLTNVKNLPGHYNEISMELIVEKVTGQLT